MHTAAQFLHTLQLAKTTDRAEWAKKALSTVLRGMEKAIEVTGAQSTLVKMLGAHPVTHAVGETYYSQIPFRYGDYVAKFALVPTSSALTSLKDAPVDLRARPNALRDEMVSLFAEQPAPGNFVCNY